LFLLVFCYKTSSFSVFFLVNNYCYGYSCGDGYGHGYGYRYNYVCGFGPAPGRREHPHGKAKTVRRLAIVGLGHFLSTHNFSVFVVLSTMMVMVLALPREGVRDPDGKAENCSSFAGD
jgi:hypothetical protein